MAASTPRSGADAARALSDPHARTALVNRIKRAEGQLRGIQRMVEEGADCMAIAGQMSAVRHALDSACVRMAVCYMEQEFGNHLGAGNRGQEAAAPLLDHIESLLAKIR